MKKLTMSSVLGALLVLGLCATQSFAITSTKTYAVSVTLPTQTPILNIKAFKIDGKGTATATDDTWSTEVSSLTLASGDVSFGLTDPGTGATFDVYKSNYYFAIEVAPKFASLSNVTLSYTEGSAPTGQPVDQKLGYKMIASAAQVTYVSATSTSEVILSEKALKNIGTMSLTSTSFPAGTWCRLYVGMWVGRAGTPPDADLKPFVASDKSGAYSGTLTISATAS
ncbi:MAG: hypothetical protein HQL25_06405 [Candidatus Omnitrophica bacterium]|nr:hypothetical protein [Candidatus Omnitrophota bacterium]